MSGEFEVRDAFASENFRSETRRLNNRRIIFAVTEIEASEKQHLATLWIVSSYNELAVAEAVAKIALRDVTTPSDGCDLTSK